MPVLTEFEIVEKQNRATMADELARLRHLNVKPVEERPSRPPIPLHRQHYEAGIVSYSRGWIPDPSRRVADAWPPTSTDGRCVTIKKDGELAEDTPDKKRKFRVRFLRGHQSGAVMDLPLAEYVMVRNYSVGGNSHVPLAEPVPADEPLSEPVAPSNMPSNFSKARDHAARALKKDTTELTFDDVVKFYRAQPVTKVFKP